LTTPPASLTACAVDVLRCGDAEDKARAARRMAAAWRGGGLHWPGAAVQVDDRPARPPRPPLVAPRHVKRRGPGSLAGRVALLHALAHIELNAVDLACDLLARFAYDGRTPMPDAFADDWVQVADEEGKHFLLLSARLGALGTAYGDLPAHDGLWEAAEATAHDVAARLAIIPLVHEARGLDVTPQTVAALERAGDKDSAGILQTIYTDEIGHVAVGVKWFKEIARRRRQEPSALFHSYVATYHRQGLKGPFNAPARQAAGLDALMGC